MDDKIWKAEDLEGIILNADRIVFALTHPDGMTLAEMDASTEGYVNRMAERIREELINE